MLKLPGREQYITGNKSDARAYQRINNPLLENVDSTQPQKLEQDKHIRCHKYHRHNIVYPDKAVRADH
jgi:hypothetical protein